MAPDFKARSKKVRPSRPAIERLEERIVLSADHLFFSQQPADVMAGATQSPAVTAEVLDASDQLVTTGAGSVTLSIASNPGGATLGGLLTKTAGIGVATFDDLTYDQPGSGYTLTAADGSLTLTSGAFNVNTVTTVDAGGLEFQASSGFNTSGTIDSASGNIQVGFEPQGSQPFTPLLEVNGQVSVDTSALTLSGSGQFQTVIDGSGTTLYNGSFSLGITDLINEGAAGLAGSSFSVAGATFTLDGLALTDDGPSGGPAIEAQGSIALPIGLNVAVDRSNHVVFDSGGLSLTGVDASLSGSATVGGLKFQADDLTVAYQPDDTFSIQGNTSVSIDGSDVSVAFGSQSDPGLVIRNGTVTAANMAVTSDIAIAGFQFDTTGLSFTYVPAQGAQPEEFTLSGSSGLTIGDDAVSVAFGTSRDPGLVLSGGKIAALDVAITSNISLYGFTFDTTGLTFGYVPAVPAQGVNPAQPEEFTLDGSVKLTFGSNTITADFGEAAKPGLVLEDDSISGLDMTLNGSLSLLGLTIAATGLQAELDTSDDVYRFGGTVTIGTQSQPDGGSSFTALSGVTATLVTPTGATAPGGLVISNGQVMDLNVTLSGDINLFGLGLTFSELSASYNASASTLEISGGASLSFGPFGGIAVTVPSSGLVIDTNDGQVFVDGLTIAFDVSLGGGDLGFSGSFSFSEQGEVTDYSASGSVTTDYGKIGASISFDRADGQTSIQDLSVDYSKSDGPGLDIGGAFITYLKGSITNIGTPQVVIGAWMDVTYGPSIDGVSLFSASGNATWTESSLTGNLTYSIADNIGGSGSAYVDLDWSANSYQFTLDGDIYDGIFAFDLAFDVSQGGDISLDGEATVNLPTSVPSWVVTFMRGSELAQLGFEFQYAPGDDSDSYGEAWVTIAGEDVGFRVNFDGQYSEILSGGLSQDFEAIGHDATQVYEETTQALAGAYDDAASAIGDGVAVTVAQLRSYEQSVANAATAAFDDAVQGVQAAYDDVTQAATDTYNAAVGAAEAVFNSDAVNDGIAMAQQDYDDALSGAQDAFNQTLSSAETAYSSAISDATSVYQSASSVVIAAANTLVTSASDALSGLTSGVEDAFNSLQSAASNALGGLEGAAEAAIQAVEAAAEEAADAVANAAEDVWDDIASWGYVAGGTVFFDRSGAGVPMPGRPYSVTAGDGHFRAFVPAHAKRGRIVLEGGIDTSTGLPTMGVATAPVHSRIISPLTSLVAEVMARRPRLSEKAASAVVDRGLGIPRSVDLGRVVLIRRTLAGSTAAARGFAAEIEVASMVFMLEGLLGNASNTPSRTALSLGTYSAVASAILEGHGARVDLSDATRVQGLIEQVAASAGVSLGADLASGTATIYAGLHRSLASKPVHATRAYLTRLVQYQVAVETDVAPALRKAGSGHATISGLLPGLTGPSLETIAMGETIGRLTPHAPSSARKGRITSASSPHPSGPSPIRTVGHPGSVRLHAARVS